MTVHRVGETAVPEFIDRVFGKTSPKRSFSLNRKQAFWLVFAKTGSINSGTENQQKSREKTKVAENQVFWLDFCAKKKNCAYTLWKRDVSFVLSDFLVK